MREEFDMKAANKERFISTKDSEMIINLRSQIRSRIEAMGSNVRALERKAGLNIGTVNNILIGTSSNPTAETLKAIADVFDCSVDELLGRKVKNSDDKDTSLKHFKEYKWNPELYTSIIEELNKQIKNRNLTISSDQVIGMINEIYLYSLKKDKELVDEALVEWLLDKTL